jgi:hypothetical protein
MLDERHQNSSGGENFKGTSHTTHYFFESIKPNFLKFQKSSNEVSVKTVFQNLICSN